ncbi:MAG TPA: AMP-binding protein [Desulfovibrio sp.]|uniref:AMP-binding protein n=1 Tax=Desulfovibrio sp. TaxID=885 RepID=UPI002CCC391D|nr:AMP-binding protein [Desulfovibrio sp.]HMM37718.1 AMP-binding protein [Desulfovibrio sp.]
MQVTETLTLKQVLERSVERHADRPALSVVDGPVMTYAELGERVRETAELLDAHGIGTGDRVALLAENMPNWGVAYFAIARIGAVAVPILPDFHQSAVHHILRHAECSAVFVSRRLACKLDDGEFEALRVRILLDDLSLISDPGRGPLKGLVKRAAKEIGRIKENTRHNRIDRGEKEHSAEAGEDVPVNSADKLRKVINAGRKEFGKIKDAALRAANRVRESGDEGSPADELAAIIYTSGTTGNSKGVMLTHRNIVSNALGSADLAGITDQDRMLSILPLSHTFECTLGLVLPLSCGASVSYLAKPPTPAILLPALQKIRPTFLLCVPLVIEKIYRNRILPALMKNAALRGLLKIGFTRRKLFQAAGRKLFETFGGALRCMCIGGAALAPEVEAFLRDSRFPYSVGYGLTECSPLVSGVMPDKVRYRHCGTALPGVEIRIDAPSPDEVGEIFVRGPNVMRGYYKAPAITEETFTPDGWLRTGDLGLLDQDGYLSIRGRLKNVILGPSGENIYPEEIESTLCQWPYVLESLVFSQGERLLARVHLDYDYLDARFGVRGLTESEAGKRIGELLEELRRGVNEKVSSFCRLHRIIEQPEPFEKTPTQKIKRYLYVDGQPR